MDELKDEAFKSLLFIANTNDPLALKKSNELDYNKPLTWVPHLLGLKLKTLGRRLDEFCTSKSKPMTPIQRASIVDGVSSLIMGAVSLSEQYQQHIIATPDEFRLIPDAVGCKRKVRSGDYCDSASANLSAVDQLLAAADDDKTTAKRPQPPVPTSQFALTGCGASRKQADTIIQQLVNKSNLKYLVEYPYKPQHNPLSTDLHPLCNRLKRQNDDIGMIVFQLYIYYYLYYI
eukprot:GHVR01108995.1.p1 GENE.GHVR01108995.1~~GHVR01108995.1.p1  ORF type:complete len:232 (-),score=52.99 GHVR01108995.1:606-1301(-)